MQILTKLVIFTFFNLAFATTAVQAAVPPASIPNPVKATTPYVPEDGLKVFAFFKFSCPVCSNYHTNLEHWGRSLPKQFTFQFIPVLEGDSQHAFSDASVRASMLFWTIERAGNKAQRSAFAEAAYEIHQNGHMQPDLKAWGHAIKAADITKPSFTKAWKAENAVWATRAERQAHYDPVSTPTLVICGKWMITPDSTNGDAELFTQLANGLLSKCMEEKGIAQK